MSTSIDYLLTDVWQSVGTGQVERTIFNKYDGGLVLVAIQASQPAANSDIGAVIRPGDFLTIMPNGIDVGESIWVRCLSQSQPSAKIHVRTLS